MLEKIAETLPHSMIVDSQTHYPTLESAVNYIDSMEFVELKNKLSRQDPLISRVWTLDELNLTEQYYKNFLYLNKKYGEKIKVIVPTLSIDEFWHHHILDTRSYFKDCQGIFGYYFHHYPYFGMRSDDDYKNLNEAFEITQVIYEEEFGERIKAVW
ncbi:glycine-rich domain-containing protein [Yersinia thracica]|uniref:glycine-rich domain-containing protein n=1 Tax=Yersinia thracica TaxID=2890319 RepID=UPI0011A7B2DE|nr:glycine-rich domain-containing protein-like [Yersinia thracica]